MIPSLEDILNSGLCLVNSFLIIRRLPYKYKPVVSKLLITYWPEFSHLIKYGRKCLNLNKLQLT